MTAVIAGAGALGVLFLFSGLTHGDTAERRRGVLDRLGLLAAEAGYPRMRGIGLLALCGTGVLCGLAIGAAVSSLLPVQLATAVAIGWLPLVRARTRRDNRRNARRHAWPDALADLVSGVRAGLSLAECCASLAQKGPEELRSGFGAFAATYAATGSFDAGLTRVRDALEDPVADRVVAVLRMAHEVGGNDLVRVLRASAEFVREDLRIRGEIRARWSWTITAARLAAAAPFTVLVIMGLRPEASAAYASSAGTATILVGTGASFVGYRLMLRAAKLPEEGRIR